MAKGQEKENGKAVEKGGGRGEHVVRVACTLPGHGDDWVEFNTESWTLREFQQFYRMTYADMLEDAIPRYCVDWHLSGDDGVIVPCPGPGAFITEWENAYGQLGDEGFVLLDWMAGALLKALRERVEAGKKRSAGRTGTS